MLRFILFLAFLFGQIHVSAQTNPFTIANIGGLNLSIETDTCLTGTVITSLSPGQKLVSSETLSSNCGIWQRVSIPSPTQHVDTFGYICGGLSALCDIVPEPSSPFVEVHNTDTAGLFVRPTPVAGHVTINGLNAKIWDGQMFSVTGNTQMVGGGFWREIYLTDNCSQLTGWVSDAFLFYHTGVGYNELTDPIQLNVYPNPATDKVLITFNNTSNNEYFVQLMDVQGKIIDHYINTNEINVSHLESAVYFLRVEQEGLSGIKRFVKL